MAKPFITAFEAWKADQRYDIGPDIGTEFYDTKEARPTRADSSSALNNGTTNPAQAL